MAQKLDGKKVAFIVANQGVEQVELTEPWKAVQDAGGTPELIATKPGKVQAFNHLDKADAFDVDRTTQEIQVDDYDGLVLAGGVANADKLRMDDHAVRFVRSWVEAGRPV